MNKSLLADISSFFSSVYYLFRGRPHIFSKDKIDSWHYRSICSCVLGISKKSTASNISDSTPYATLLLLDKNIDYDVEYNLEKEIGIIIEYGDFSPDMTESEKKNSKNRAVIYPYGDKGGLRYYIKKYGEFIKEFGDIGYVDLNIELDNMYTFWHFINKIANSEDNKWIKENYSLDHTNFNSHTFVIEALKIIKPYFNFVNVNPTEPNLAQKKNMRRLDFIPSDIIIELINYYQKI